MDRVDVAIIGAGQAGLSVSQQLTGHDVEHVVLERDRIGQTWRGRWDTFCLVTPNWMLQLPGGQYDGGDPDGFMPRDDVVAYLERYAARSAAPVRQGVDVRSIESGDDGFTLTTTDGQVLARRVVLATGAYQRAHRPSGAETLPADLLQLDIEQYRNEQALPPGPILVIGSGQSGCQIAEELHENGRDVVLACGRAPWSPRRIGAHDLAWWGLESGFLDVTVDSLPDPSVRLVANVLATGHGGGHDLHLRTLRAMGITLVGHFLGSTDGIARFAPDLAETVAWGDERYGLFMDLVRQTAAELGEETPDIPDPEPFDASAPEAVDVRGFGAVLFAGGFRPDYRAWLPWPDAFDDLGFPIHRDGESTVVPGLHFIGVHFLRKRKSSIFVGVGEDAIIVARQIAAGLGRPVAA